MGVKKRRGRSLMVGALVALDAASRDDEDEEVRTAAAAALAAARALASSADHE